MITPLNPKPSKDDENPLSAKVPRTPTPAAATRPEGHPVSLCAIDFECSGFRV